LVGTIGPAVQSPPPGTGGFIPSHFDLTIEHGTNQFSGALGSATIDTKLDASAGNSGQIAGSFSA